MEGVLGMADMLEDPMGVLIVLMKRSISAETGLPDRGAVPRKELNCSKLVDGARVGVPRGVEKMDARDGEGEREDNRAVMISCGVTVMSAEANAMSLSFSLETGVLAGAGLNRLVRLGKMDDVVDGGDSKDEMGKRGDAADVSVGDRGLNSPPTIDSKLKSGLVDIFMM